MTRIIDTGRKQVLEKGKRKKKREKRNIYSLRKMTKELKRMGEKNGAGIILLTYLGVFLLVLLLGFLYKLKPVFLIAAECYWILSVPQLLTAQIRGSYEKKRFQDVNAYMVQMAQSFISSKSIYRALQETYRTFPAGEMHDTVEAARNLLDSNMAEDVRKAERGAMDLVESQYECDKLRQLHHFFMTAETRGGNCNMEFELLEKNRVIWEKTVLDYHNRLSFAKTGVTAEFLMLMVICAFMLSRFPDYISINGSAAVQLLNTVQIICLGMLYKHMSRRASLSMLQAPKEMTEERADKYFSYLKNYNGKAEFMKNLPFTVLAAVVGAVLILVLKNTVSVVIAVLLFCSMLFLHTLTYLYRYSSLKKELKLRFPGWLFDIIMLLQKESVAAAIVKTQKNAPVIMQDELALLCGKLVKNPADTDAYLSFFVDFHLPEIENTMRRLYSLGAGTGGKTEMTVIIDSALEMITDAEKNVLKNKGDMTVIYTYLPMIPVGVSLIGYCIVLMITVFQYMVTLI